MPQVAYSHTDTHTRYKQQLQLVYLMAKETGEQTPDGRRNGQTNLKITVK